MNPKFKEGQKVKLKNKLFEVTITQIFYITDIVTMQNIFEGMYEGTWFDKNYKQHFTQFHENDIEEE
jgi:uncharacterized protein YodC (DUF2158 family)